MLFWILNLRSSLWPACSYKDFLFRSYRECKVIWPAKRIPGSYYSTIWVRKIISLLPFLYCLILHSQSRFQSWCHLFLSLRFQNHWQHHFFWQKLIDSFINDEEKTISMNFMTNFRKMQTYMITSRLSQWTDQLTCILL